MLVIATWVCGAGSRPGLLQRIFQRIRVMGIVIGRLRPFRPGRMDMLCKDAPLVPAVRPTNPVLGGLPK